MRHAVKVIAIALYRDTYTTLPAIAAAVNSNATSVNDLVRHVKRDPKYPRPLRRGELKPVRLPRLVARGHPTEMLPQHLQPEPVPCHDPHRSRAAWQADRAKAVDLWNDGLSARAIHRRLKRARSTVDQWLRAANVDRSRPRHCYEQPLPFARNGAQQKGCRAARWLRT